jgi:AcrR family transcriptional regulator
MADSVPTDDTQAAPTGAAVSSAATEAEAGRDPAGRDRRSQGERGEGVRASDGRVPGRRGRATRQRLLDFTAEMLRTTSYRDLKVIDIAREAGTSPATFYQYFSDVEAAILVLGEEMAVESEGLVQIVREGNWRGKAGYETALAFADAFIAFWDEHRPVLRVVDLSTDEGDRRFRSVRVKWLNNITRELAKVTEMFQAEGKNLGVDAMADAGVLVTMVAHVAAHHYGFELWGIPTSDVRISLARHVYWGVTGQRPPSE